MNFILEKWDISHISSIAKHANNKKIADNLRDAFPFPYTYADAELYVTDCMKKEGYSQLTRAIVINDEAVGSIGIFVMDDVYRKSAELGYWLSEEYWGQGIMSAAVKQLCREVFQTFDIVRIFAEPFRFNTGSACVLEKAGFMLEGIKKSSVCKYGTMFDSCLYALLKKDSLGE